MVDYYYNDRWQLLTEIKNGAADAIYQWHPYYIDALNLRMRASDMHWFTHDATDAATSARNPPPPITLPPRRESCYTRPESCMSPIAPY